MSIQLISNVKVDKQCNFSLSSSCKIISETYNLEAMFGYCFQTNLLDSQNH